MRRDDNLSCLVHHSDLSGAAFVDISVGIRIDSGEVGNAIVAWLTVDDKNIPRSGDKGSGCRNFVSSDESCRILCWRAWDNSACNRGEDHL